MKTYFSIARHVRGALWARTLGYPHGWKNKTDGGVTCTSKIAVKTKKCATTLDRVVKKKQDQFPWSFAALYNTRRCNRFARHDHPLVTQGRSKADLTIQKITPTKNGTRPILPHSPPPAADSAVSISSSSSSSSPSSSSAATAGGTAARRVEGCEGSRCKTGPANGAAASPLDLKQQGAWTVPWSLRYLPCRRSTLRKAQQHLQHQKSKF